jgi:hypothetical protein
MSESSFRSPFAALVWKEWRESWWLLILVILGPTAWTIVARNFFSPDGKILALLLLCGLPLGLAAGLFARERIRGTDAFQNERPIERGAGWNAKLFLPLLAVVSGAIPFGLACPSLWPVSDAPVDALVFTALAAIVWFLFFAFGTLCSVLLDRPLTAGAAGAVLGIMTLGGQCGLFAYLVDKGEAPDEWYWLLALCLLAEVILVLWLSRIMYVRWTRD